MVHPLKKAFPEIEEHVCIAPFTTLKIGGKARFFYRLRDQEVLPQLLKKIKQLRLPYIILGGGSCVLVSSKLYPGVVIHNEMSKVTIQGTKVTATAGTPLNQVINMAMKAGLRGMEGLTGIPGTIGGAVAGNVGIPDREMRDIIESVKILDYALMPKVIPNRQCAFAYRTSRFKKRKEYILEVTFRLKKGDPKEILEEMKFYREGRNKKHPHDPSAGSWFKNPSPKKPAGMLLDKLGLKGFCVGDACISEKHANFFINKGEATSEDMRKLSKICKQKVWKAYKIKLEEEVLYLSYNPVTAFLASNPFTRYFFATFLFLLGLSGIILPILPGWIFIFIAIEIIAPLKGWEIIHWLVKKFHLHDILKKKK